MTSMISNIILIALASVFIINVVDQLKYFFFYQVYSRKTEYRPYRLKPLDCYCLAVYLGFAYFQLYLHVNPTLSCLLSFASATTALITQKLINKL